MAFSPNLFFSNMRKHDGPARPCKFHVVLPIPTYIGNYISMSVLQQIIDLSGIVQDLTTNFVNNIFSGDTSTESADPTITRYLSLQCDSAEIPGMSLMSADVKIYGPSYKVPYQRDLNDITLSFICTNDFYERKLFDRWMECIMPSDTYNMRFPKGANSRYLTDITVIQFDEFIKQVYAIKIKDAFPISVASMPLNWADDSVHRLTVQFACTGGYQYIHQGNYDIGQAAGVVMGTFLNRFLGDFQQDIFTT